MAQLWPWLLVAGTGALHGLNPCTGWLLAAASGLRAGNRRRVLGALLPLAIGHAAAIAAVAGLAAAGMRISAGPLPWMATALLAASALAGGLRAQLRRLPRLPRLFQLARPAIPARVARVARLFLLPSLPRLPGLPAPAGPAGLALSSFLASSVHGTGLMLVPALVPLCLGNSAARQLTASGSLLRALAAVGVHLAAMLAVTGGVALAAWRTAEATRRHLRADAAQDIAASPRPRPMLHRNGSRVLCGSANRRALAFLQCVHQRGGRCDDAGEHATGPGRSSRPDPAQRGG